MCGALNERIGLGLDAAQHPIHGLAEFLSDRQGQGQAFDCIGAREHLGELGIREVTNLYEGAPGSRKPVVTHTLSRLTDTQRQLYDLLHLDRHRARSTNTRDFRRGFPMDGARSSQSARDLGCAGSDVEGDSR